MEYLRDDGCWSALWQQLGDVAVKGKPIFFSFGNKREARSRARWQKWSSKGCGLCTYSYDGKSNSMRSKFHPLYEVIGVE
jgi:hypothetical protein